MNRGVLENNPIFIINRSPEINNVELFKDCNLEMITVVIKIPADDCLLNTDARDCIYVHEYCQSYLKNRTMGRITNLQIPNFTILTFSTNVDLHKKVYPTNKLEFYIQARALSINGIATFSVEFFTKTEYFEPHQKYSNNIPTIYPKTSGQKAPWSGTVHLYSKSQYLYSCGAVLLTPRFVLSSGHCLKSFKPKQATNNIQTEFEGKLSDALYWILHPKYKDIQGGYSWRSGSKTETLEGIV